MPRHPRTLRQLRADPRVAEVSQEIDGCFDGYRRSYWLDLAPGWTHEGCIQIHEPTIARLCLAMRGLDYDEPTPQET